MGLLYQTKKLLDIRPSLRGYVAIWEKESIDHHTNEQFLSRSEEFLSVEEFDALRRLVGSELHTFVSIPERTR